VYVCVCVCVCVCDTSWDCRVELLARYEMIVESCVRHRMS